MGKTDPNASRHLQQSMIVVPQGHARASPSAARRTCSATTTAAATPRSIYENVRVPADNLLGEEGGGFAISQARLGPGRIHHCMRSIGVAERALELHGRAARCERTTFGTLVAQKGLIQDWIAESRIEIDMAREYVLRAAHLMDTVGNKAAATEISGIKVAVPNMALQGHRPGHPGARRRRRHASTPRWPRCTPTCARCASPTAPTRSTR